MEVIANVIMGILVRSITRPMVRAVEVTRAGDQGRGFAVVAGEVRSPTQVSYAVNNLDQMPQQNATLVEESAAAAALRVPRLGQG